MGTALSGIVGALPAPRSRYFIPTLRRVVSERLIHCPIENGRIRYVSDSLGNDANDGLTTATPWATLSRVSEHLDTIDDDCTYKFLCGDTWKSTTGIVIDKPFVSCTFYGIGNKPLIDNFTGTFAGEDFSAVGGGDNSFLYNEAVAAVQWIINRANPFRFYTRATSQANCSATVGSWFASGGSLWVRPFADEVIAEMTFDAVLATSSVDGITIEDVDGCRIHGLAGRGYGMNLASPITQRMAFATRVGGTNAAVISCCDAWFGSTHLLQQYAGSGGGGFATYYGNRAGGALYNAAGGETIYNTFATDGTTAETIFAGNETTYGTLPHNSWVSATVTKRGRSVYGHNGALAQHALALVLDHSTKANDWGAEAPAGIDGYQSAETNIANIKTFIINEVFEENDRAGLGLWQTDSGAVRINCRYQLKINNIASQAIAVVAASTMRVWNVGCTFDIDVTNHTGTLMLTNETPGGNTTNFIMANCQLNWSETKASTNYGLTHDGYAASGSGDRLHPVYNTIVTRESGTGFVISANGNSSTINRNNALWGVFTGGTAGYRWDGDSSEVALGSTWTVGLRPTAAVGASLIGTGTNLAAEGLDFEYDASGLIRLSSSAPSIGPLEPFNSAQPLPVTTAFQFGFNF